MKRRDFMPVFIGASAGALFAGAASSFLHKEYALREREKNEEMDRRYLAFVKDSLPAMGDEAFEKIMSLEIIPDNITKPDIVVYDGDESKSDKNRIYLPKKYIRWIVEGLPDERKLFLWSDDYPNKITNKKQLAEANFWYKLCHETVHCAFFSAGFTEDLPLYEERHESPAIIYGLEKTWEKGENENNLVFQEYVQRMILDLLWIYNHLYGKDVKVEDLHLEKGHIDLKNKENEMDEFLRKCRNLEPEKIIADHKPYAEGFVNGCLKREKNYEEYLNYIGIK